MRDYTNTKADRKTYKTLYLIHCDKKRENINQLSIKYEDKHQK